MMYIRTAAPLYRVCEQAKTAGMVALDVEFIRENTYVPQLGLIQVALRETSAIIDPLEVGDLTPLLELVHSPDILKILHAAGQDMEVLFWHSGRPPTRVFDTQIAAAITGMGEQLSYGRLVERVLGVTLAKTESYSDWLQRPLTPAQIAYAVDDVRYLHALYDTLSARLAEMGRTVWALEEFRKFENLELYQRDPRTLFRRIRRGRSLSSQGLAVLRELADWRDQEARQRNRPPGSILRDELLVEIARKAPQTLDNLPTIRGLARRELERSGPTLIAMIQRGLAVADHERPATQRRPRLTRTEELMAMFLDTYLKAFCHRHKLPASCLATRADLEQLVYCYRHGRLTSKGSPLLEGWRGALVGQELLAVLQGRESLHLDPETGELQNTPRSV
jgi:ribonuclease D